MHSNNRTMLTALLLLSVLAAACAGGGALEGSAQEGEAGQAGGAQQTEQTGEGTADSGGGEVGTIAIGSANFPEQVILANLYADVLEDAGVAVDRSNLNLGSREVVFPALTSGQLDLVPEYSGALLSFLTEGEAEAEEPGEVMERLREELPDGVVALEPSSAEDKDALVVTAETAQEHDLESIGDLAEVEEPLVIGGPPEMETRASGLPGLEEVYGVTFEEFRPLDAGGPLTTEALLSGQIDVARMFSTQGVIDEQDLVVLDDPQNLSPAQQIVPIIREEVLNDAVRGALDELSATLTTADLTALNRQVEVDRRDPDAVAREYLQDNGLVG